MSKTGHTELVLLDGTWCQHDELENYDGKLFPAKYDFVLNELSLNSQKWNDIFETINPSHSNHPYGNVCVCERERVEIVEDNKK